jgi:hypothetical protein
MLLPTPRRSPEANPCLTCERGCGCSHADPGCGHYGCYGARPARDCPGVAAEEQRYADACRQRRAEEARRLTARDRWAATYRAVVASTIPRPRQ